MKKKSYESIRKLIVKEKEFEVKTELCADGFRNHFLFTEDINGDDDLVFAISENKDFYYMVGIYNDTRIFQKDQVDDIHKLIDEILIELCERFTFL